MNHGVTAVGRHWCATEIQNAFNATDRQITTILILIAIVFFLLFFSSFFFSQTSHLYLEIELFVVVVFVIIVLQVL